MSPTTTNEPLPEDFDLAAIMRQTTGVVCAPSEEHTQSASQVSESQESQATVPVEPPPKPPKRSRKKSSDSETAPDPETAPASTPTQASDNYTWKRSTFICDKGISEKLHDIARNEGYPVSAVMKLMLQRGIEAYEKKHGEVKHTNKSLDDLL